MSKNIQLIIDLLKRCERTIERNGTFIMVILLWLIIEFSFWALNSTRSGSEIAMVMGAVLTPMVGLFKYVLEYSDKKD